MRRREILVFTAAFVVVLLGGAALAQVGTFTSTPAADTALEAASADAGALSAAEATDADAVASESAAATTVAASSAEPTANRSADTETETEPTEPPKDEEEPSDPPKEDEDPVKDEDTTPPPLKILFPENEQHFDDKTVAFEGETEPGARVFGGNYEADVDADGNWRIVLILSPGGNTVKFKAKDAAGNITEKSIKVYLDAEEEVDKDFTANQKWEVFDGTPPKNKYYGTGTPGTTVWVGSEYGDGSGKIGSNGEWLFYVEFPNAPCNEWFTVVVENETNRRVFETKWACASHEFSVTHQYAENTSLWTKFYGTGNPGDTIWAVSEYGEAQTTVESNGEWFVKVHFSDDVPPNDEIKVVIESSSGDRAEFWYVWIVEQEKEVDFTANQKYGSCDAEVPYDKFWGTAEPGATIWIESPYGGGTTTAGEAGNWDLQVEFPEAPFGETFTVVIESSDGGRATFSFTRLGSEK